MSGNPAQDMDRLLEAFYAAAFHLEWVRFRPHALELLCAATGASAAAWLTRASSDLPGEYARWPDGAAIEQPAVRALSFATGEHVRYLTDIQPGLGPEKQAVALSLAHRGTHLHSVLLLSLPPTLHPDAEYLLRAGGHLLQAGTLALSQFVRRDEWLHALGRASRGSSALIDEHGAVYVASQRFRELIGAQYGNPDFAELPFPLPTQTLEEGGGDFSLQGVHFRLNREGNLFLLHARRPHPLDGLSPREQEIARALGQGKTFKSVARDYDIAISTVANHASRIYKKLGLYRREDLVALLRTAATFNRA